jgi:hypothetical protein
LVLSPSRITPENNGKIRPQPDRENAFARASGGEGVCPILFRVVPERSLKAMFSKVMDGTSFRYVPQFSRVILP